MLVLKTLSPIHNLIYKIYFKNNNVTLVIKKKHLINLTNFLKLHSLCQFQTLIDISGVDFLSYPYKQWLRFAVVYNLLSIKFVNRIQFFLYTKEVEIVSTLIYIYKNASWFERETWDLFGIKFNNPDLRRLLTDYGHEGFPLRKDYPMTGFKEVIYSDSLKRILYKPVELAQEYRSFILKNPWVPSITMFSYIFTQETSYNLLKYFLLSLLFFVIVTPIFQNAVYMCLLLSLSFFFLVNMFFYLGLELLPAIILIVYVGAILVVLLFSIFNLNIKTSYFFEQSEFSTNLVFLFLLLIKLVVLLPFYFNEINLPLFRPTLATKAFEAEYLIDLYVGIYKPHFIIAAFILLFVSFALTYIVKIKFMKNHDGI